MKVKAAIRPFFLSLFSVWIFLHFFSIIVWSVAVGWRYPDILPRHFSTDGYKVLLEPKGDVVRGIITSTIIALIVGFLSTVIGTAAGRAIGMYNFKYKKAFQFLVLAPLIVPSLAVTMGIQVLFIKYRLANSIQGVILAHLIPTIPYVVMIMSGIFANFDRSYEEQGRVLGASKFKTSVKITLPIILPGLAVSFLFAFVISWSEYILTLLVGGGVVVTLPMALFSYLGGYDIPLIGVASLVFMIPPLILLRFTGKHLVGRSSSVTGLGKI